MRTAGVEPDARLPFAAEADLVVVAWARRAVGRGRIRRAAHELGRRRRVLLVTNVDPARLSFGEADVRVAGAAELSAELDARPALRRRVPFVLGVRELDGLLDAEAVARSTFDVAAASALARVFVPTQAYLRTLDVLERHRFAVLTGPPEMGKTAIARTLGLAALTEGWEVHECTSPDELWARFARDRRQVFVADDAFGATEYRPEAAERWALELDRVLRAMDARHRLVWTSRPAPLHAALRRIQREHGVERWPRPAEVQVAAAALDVEEKAVILFRHAQAAQVSPQAIGLVRQHGWEIVEHEHFTPERIRRFVDSRLRELAEVRGAPDALRDAVLEEIREPTAAMAASLRALEPDHRALLVALVDAPPGPVSQRELTAAMRRHHPEGLRQTPSELVDRLTDHFVRLVPPDSVAWVHPSWRDLVIAELAADAAARARFLERCGLDGLLLALSTAGGAAGERTLPLLVADADWDLLSARLHELVPELDDHDLLRTLATVRETVAAAPDVRAADEARAVAVAVLARARSAWERDRAAPSVGVLAAWFELRVATGDSLEPPPLGRTWVDLVPTRETDLADPVDLGRLEDWLSLVDVLRAHDRRALAALDFPVGQDDALRNAVASAARLGDADDVSRDRAAGTLSRLSASIPTLHDDVVKVLRLLERPHDAPGDWWEPDLGPELPRRRPAPRERSVVDRILLDLRGG